MNQAYIRFQRYRPYRHDNFFRLINRIICNRYMQSPFLSQMTPYMFNGLSKLISKRGVNWLISHTFGACLTGGSNFNQLSETVNPFISKQTPFILSYFPQKQYKNFSQEWIMNQNSQKINNLNKIAQSSSDCLIQIRLSSLINRNLLVKYSNSIKKRNKIWQSYQKDGKITAQNLLYAFQQIYRGTAQQQLLQYAQLVHKFQGTNLKQFSIDQIDFKTNHHAYYFQDDLKQANENLLAKVMMPLSHQQRVQITSAKDRIQQIINNLNASQSHQKRIVFQAQEDDIQEAIDDIVAQLQQRHNKDKVFIINTLRCQEGSSNNKLNFQLERIKKKELQLGIQIFKAQSKQPYQKSKGDSSNQVENEDTLMNIFNRIIKSQAKGQTLVYCNNQATIQQLLQHKRSASSNIKVSFGTTLGVGDHITQWLQSQNQKAYTLIQYVQKQALVPYVTHIATQLSKDPSRLVFNNKLIKRQILRIVFPKA